MISKTGSFILALLIMSGTPLKSEQKSLWKKFATVLIGALLISSGSTQATQPELPSTCLNVFNGEGDFIDAQHCARNLESHFGFNRAQLENGPLTNAEAIQNVRELAQKTNLCVPYYSRFDYWWWKEYIVLLCTQDSFRENFDTLKNIPNLPAERINTYDESGYKIIEYPADTNFIPNEPLNYDIDWIWGE